MAKKATDAAVTNETITDEAAKEEPKLTPLQRVKQQQSRMQQARSAGTSRKISGEDDEAGTSEGGAKRIDLQRRSGGG